MRGAVDLSPRAELAMSEEQVSELWSRARVAGVLVTVVELKVGRFQAAVAGFGSRGVVTDPSPYLAGLRAIDAAAVSPAP